MKRILAVILSAVVMLSACAFTTRAPGDNHSYTLSDMAIYMDDQVIDMSSLAVEFDVVESEDSFAVLLHTDVDGEPVTEIGLTKTDGLYVLHLQSEYLGHKDYAIDPVRQMTKELDDLRDGLIEMLQNTDTAAIAQRIQDAIESPSTPAEEPAIDIEEAMQQMEDADKAIASLPKLSFEGDLMAVLEECVSEPETVTMGGEYENSDGSVTNIPEGEYLHTIYTMDLDHILQILGMIRIDGEPIDLSKVLSVSVDDEPVELPDLKEAGIDFVMEGSFYESQDDPKCSFGSLSGTLDNGDSVLTGGSGYLSTETEDGSSITFGMGRIQDDQTTGLKFTCSKGVHEDLAFGPDAVDLDQVILLNDMDEEEAFAVLREDLSMVLAETVGQLTAPIIDATMPEGGYDLEMEVPAE